MANLVKLGDEIVNADEIERMEEDYFRHTMGYYGRKYTIIRFRSGKILNVDMSMSEVLKTLSIGEIPVPHGDLIDRNDLIARLCLFKEELRSSTYEFIREIIMDAGVIVERRER